MQKTYGKKLLSLGLMMLFLMSLLTALPVSAEGTITATVNGIPLADSGTTSAVSDIVFTLPQAVYADQILFFEQSKFTSTTAADGTTQVDSYYPLYSRVCTPTVNGTTVTIPFAAGALSSDSTYKVVFDFDDDDVVDEGESFTFSTTAAVEDGITYYVRENYSRYPLGGVAVDGWGGAPVYSDRSDPIVHLYGYTGVSGGKKSTNAGQFVSWNNKSAYLVSSTNRLGYIRDYAAALPSGTTSHLGKTTFTFGFELADESQLTERDSLVNMGDFAIRPNGKNAWQIYAIRAGLPGGSSSSFPAKLTEAEFSQYYTKLGDVDLTIAPHNVTEHKVELVTNTTTSNARTLYKVILDGKEYGADVLEGGLSLGSDNRGIFFKYSLSNSSTAVFSRTRLTDGTLGVNLYVTSLTYCDYQNPPIELAADANADTYAASQSLSWTMTEKVANASLAEGVKLEQEHNGEWLPMDAADFVSLSGDKKTITASFPSGALTPGMSYRIGLTTALASAEGANLQTASTPVSFTAVDTDDYYLYETFERFPAAKICSSPGTYLNYDQKQVQPFYRQAGYIGNTTPTDNNYATGIYSDTDGDKYLCIAGDNAKIHAWKYDLTKAMALPEGEGRHKGVAEFVFSYDGALTQGTEDFLLVFGGIALQRDVTDQTKWHVYYQTQKFSYNTDAYVYDTDEDGTVDSNLAGFTEIGTWTTDKALTDKHILKIETYTGLNASGYEDIMLHGLTIDGESILTEEIGEGLQLASNGHFVNRTGIYWSGSGENTTIFAIVRPTADTKGQGRLNVYDVKYYDAIDIAVSQETASGVTFTLKNDSLEAIDCKAVLAVYNGDKLVGIDGLDDASITLAAGAASETITRLVANAAAGYTYKLMLWNSKDSMQPLWWTTQGAIQ